MSAEEVAKRALGSVVGSLIADAAAAPLHWIYDLDRVTELVKDRREPEFYERSHCPFYTIPVGRNTCYGEQALVLLRSLVDCKGFNKEDYKKKLYETFGPDSDYEVKLNHSGPPVRSDYPIKGPWRNGSIREFLQNYVDGKEITGKPNDSQADCFSKMAPLVALYAGDPDLPSIAEQVIRVTQEDDLAVKLGVAAAHILEQAILHGPDCDLLHKVQHKFDAETTRWQESVEAVKSQDHATTLKDLGTSCSLPGSFLSSLHCLMQSDGTFHNTVRSSLTAAGDNSSRCCLIGGAMGAQVGLDGLPEEWIKKSLCGSEVVQLAEKLVSMRKN